MLRYSATRRSAEGRRVIRPIPRSEGAVPAGRSWTWFEPNTCHQQTRTLRLDGQGTLIERFCSGPPYTDGQ
jgi:hypothetical protein